MKTYSELAQDDYRGAMGLAELEMWNLAGQHLQQACEKKLKGFNCFNNYYTNLFITIHVDKIAK
ncbi:MAG: hypothetical protein FWH01_13845 [Oscillospiraceae bacterium]|nr:hypothetical protein [Oscillospiraceae bacterium]